MTKMDHQTSKRAIGVALVLASMLIMLGIIAKKWGSRAREGQSSDGKGVFPKQAVGLKEQEG